MAISKIPASGISASLGISMVDQFRLTSNLTADADPISANLERVDDASFSQIGTGMTLSSGIYTFPTTGLFQVSVNASFQIAQDVNADVETFVSSDSGSNYDQVALATGGEQSSNFSNFVLDDIPSIVFQTYAEPVLPVVRYRFGQTQCYDSCLYIDL